MTRSRELPSRRGPARQAGLRPRSLAALSVLLAAAGCSAAATPPASTKAKDDAAGAATPSFLSPARYLLTQSQGAIFDEATKGSAVPRSEAALVSGKRVMLQGGVVAESAQTPSGLVGFRSLPGRLGGGYLVWSDARTYHAKDFLGALTPIVEIGPTAGARPWFQAILLRTDRGIFELDLKTRAAKRWAPQPGIVDALSLDEKRGVTIDAMGRVRSTTDGGATWVDVTAARGFFSNGARLGKKGEIELLSLSGSAEYRLMPGASAVEPMPPPPPPYSRRYSSYGYGSYPYQYGAPPPPDSDTVEPISQTLAPDPLAWAMSAGLQLGGDRAIVGRDGGLFVFSTKTGGELNAATLLDVDTKYAGCQPVRSGTTLLLACAHTEGAEVLVLDGPVVAPKLEATFPDVGTFIADERGHLAFTGRCGRTPPSADDFGTRVAQRPELDVDDQYGGPYGGYGGYDPEYQEEPPEPIEREKPPDDDKRICVRLEGGHWIEHRLSGDEARDLYRWVLGNDGEVTALLLEGANPESDEEKEKENEKEDGGDDGPLRKPRSQGGAAGAAKALLATTSTPQAGKPPPAPPPPAAKKPPAKPEAKPKADAAKPPAKGAAAKPEKPPAAHDGMRIVRLDPKDRGIKHGKWVHVPAAQQQAPWRSIDRTSWIEDDGSIRGWVKLPEEGLSERDLAAMAEESGEKPSPVTQEVTGRFAGARISPQGKATLLPLPAHVQSVIFGGRFGFARSTDDSSDKTTYYETTDGGATWSEVVGPPVGEMEESYDESRWPACSALGCVLGSGLVRLGWGSPKPAPAKKEKESPPSGTADAFPMPRLPRLECTFEGEPEVFPPPPPKPKGDSKPAAPGSPKAPAAPPISDDALSMLPPEIQEMVRQNGGSLPPGLAGLLPPGLLPPGLLPTASPLAPPPPGLSTASPVAPPAPSASPSAKPAAKPAKTVAPKAPPPPPAEVVSLRTKPQTALGQLKEKNWSADFVVPFDPTAPVKHASAAANGLDKITGSVTPVLGERGVDLLLSWDKRRALLGAAAPSLAPFEYAGKFVSAAFVPGAAGAKGAAAGGTIAALDEERRAVVLIQSDASRAVLRAAKVPDPTRGRYAIARRLDAPGAGLIWYSTVSGDVLVGGVDFARAEIGPLSPLASLATLADGGLPVCSAGAKPAGPTYQFLAEISIALTVSAHSGKSLLNESASPVVALIRATSERLCIAGIEVRGSGRPLDLTASFGAKPAAVARSRSSWEDPSKLSIDKLSCSLIAGGSDSKPAPAITPAPKEP